MPTDTLLRAQSYFERALHGGIAEIGGQTVCCEDLFQGARVLASLLAPRSPSSRAPARHQRRSLELARVQARAYVVLRVAEVLASWPLGFKRIAKDQHLTQRSFVRNSLPDWLRSAVEELQVGRTRHAMPRKHHALRAKLERDRRCNTDWRATRAALLWQAASK